MERQHRRLHQHQAAQLTHSLGGQARARDEALAKLCMRTATFMLLPSWNKKMTTSPYASLCRKCPHISNFLGTIPSDQLHMQKCPSEKHTNTTFQTLLGIEDHCHMEH